jgi:hypothetical protein
MMINIWYHRSVTIGTTNGHLILFHRRVTVVVFIGDSFSTKRFDFAFLSMSRRSRGKVDSRKSSWSPLKIAKPLRCHMVAWSKQGKCHEALRSHPAADDARGL